MTNIHKKYLQGLILWHSNILLSDQWFRDSDFIIFAEFQRMIMECIDMAENEQIQTPGRPVSECLCI